MDCFVPFVSPKDWTYPQRADNLEKRRKKMFETTIDEILFLFIVAVVIVGVGWFMYDARDENEK